jgi:hypothetical protein
LSDADATRARGLSPQVAAGLVLGAGAIDAAVMLLVAAGPATEAGFVAALAAAPYACLLPGLWKRGIGNLVLATGAGACLALALVMATMSGNNGAWAPVLTLLFQLPLALLVLVVVFVSRIWIR